MPGGERWTHQKDLSPRRDGAVAVHSLHRFVFTVPDLDVAAAFYYGFRPRRAAHGRRASTCARSAPIIAGARSHQQPGPKRLQYVSFGAFAGRLRPDRRAPRQRSASKRPKPHPLADEEGTWFADPDGTPVQLVVSRKVTPAGKARRGRDARRRPGVRCRAVALEGRQGAAAPAFAHPALQLRRACDRCASIRTRWACACPITPATSSPSCTARMRATTT